MSNLYKDLDDAGLAAVVGKIKEITENTLVVEANKYDKSAKKSSMVPFTVDMTSLGGTGYDPEDKEDVGGFKTGMQLAVIGLKNGKDDKGNIIINAKAADIGNCRVEYQGFAVISGECYFTLKDKKNKPGQYIDAKIKAMDRESEREVSNHVGIYPFKNTNNPDKPSVWDRILESLRKSAEKNHLEKKTYANELFEGYPYESCFVIKDGEDGPSEIREFTPTEGKNQGQTYYSRYDFAWGADLNSIGFPMMDLIKERAERAAAYAADQQADNEAKQAKEEDTPVAGATEEVASDEVNITENDDLEMPDYSE